MFVAGCSATQAISNHANSIRSEARLLEEHGARIADPEVVSRSARIYELAGFIHDELPNTTDKIPAWMELAGWIAIAVVSIAVVIILWQTGIGTAIRIAIGWIPKRKIQDADLAIKMLDPDKSESPREYVAARRGADPEFDAALRRLNARKDNADSR